MNITYILSQICVIISYICLGIGIRKEKRIHILVYSNIYNLFLIISYILLGAISGTISCSVSFIKNFIYMHDENNNKSTSYYIMAFFAVITIVLTIIFYNSLIDIFPCTLTVISIFTGGNRKTVINRFGCLFSSVCWIIYAIAFKSWFVIICESYISTSAIIGLIKHNYRNLSSVHEREN